MSENAVYRMKSNHLAELPGVGIRTKLLDIAATLDDVIAMGRGDPDLDTPQHIIEAGQKALETGKTHYTHVRGTIELRKAIAEKMKRDNNLDYDPENEIMVTVGAEMAMFLACYAIINPGDEVIVPTPRYTSYDEAITMWGGKIVEAKVTPDDDFAYKPEEIRKCITKKTKAISIVNPGNPIGLIDADTIREIAKLAVEFDLIVISDEIYENIIFDGTKHLSVAAIPGMKERTITLNGPSKSYAMTGWRVGFLAAPAPICEMLTEPSHTIAICCPAVSQAAALAAYTGSQDCVREMRKIYDERRTFMSQALDEMGLSYVKPRAGFYLFTDVASLGMTPDEFCMRLLKEEKVLIFPGALFADPTNRFVRISMLAPTDRIKLAAERMKRFVKKVRS